MKKILITGILIPPEPASVLTEIAQSSGVYQLRVSSFGRTAAEQARVMFDHCARHGVAATYALYANAGDQVIAIYERCRTGGAACDHEAVIADMLAKIKELGEENVSRHCSDRLWVPDISSLNGVPVRESPDVLPAFIAAAKAHPQVSRVLHPPKDPECVHLEILKSLPPGPKPPGVQT